MTTALPPWESSVKTLYRAAVLHHLETDRSVQPQQVSQAEEAVKAVSWQRIFFTLMATAFAQNISSCEKIGNRFPSFSIWRSTSNFDRKKLRIKANGSPPADAGEDGKRRNDKAQVNF